MRIFNSKTATTFLSFFMLIQCPIAVGQDHEASKNVYENQSEEYVGIVGIGKLMSTKWKIEIDFGQAYALGIKNKNLMRDESGKTIAFNSPIDALNFMNARGWTLVTASADDDYFYAVMKRAK